MSHRQILANARKEYERGGLVESEVAADPFEQFERWYAEASASRDVEPNAMTVATASPEGHPSARIVLLKDFDRSGFVFYTSYVSSKARDLERNPRASLLFYWPHLERQVKISGSVTRTTREESEAYFRTRPRGSQIAAHIGRQSDVVAGRAELEAAYQRLEGAFAGREVPLPEHWGGYRVIPELFEFWQGRVNRLHDRIRYAREGDSWRIDRLGP